MCPGRAGNDEKRKGPPANFDRTPPPPGLAASRAGEPHGGTTAAAASPSRHRPPHPRRLPSPPPPPPVPALARRPRRPQRPPRRRQSRLRVGPSSSLFRRHVRPATAMWVGDMRLVGRKCTPEGLRGTSLKMPLLSRSSILLEIVRLVFSCFATKLANTLGREGTRSTPVGSEVSSFCLSQTLISPFSTMGWKGPPRWLAGLSPGSATTNRRICRQI